MATASWDHRIVRRYNNEGEPYMVITEVHYRDGRPWSFALDWSPMGYDHDAEGTNSHTDAAALDSLKWAVDKMRDALALPPLDEKKDFTASALQKATS